MAAKKGAKGKKVEGGGEGEVKEESIMEVRSKLDEALAMIDYLRANNTSLEKQIEQMDLEKRNIAKSHEEEVQLVYDEAKTRQTTADLKIEELNGLIKRYESEVQGANILQEEATKLRESVRSLTVKLEEEGRHHAMETHELTQKTFKLRMQLEQTFRKTLKEMEGQYKEAALETMKEESKQALHANQLLREELELQSNGIHSMMKRFDRTTEDLRDMRIEKQLALDSNGLLNEEIAAFKRQSQLLEGKVKSMESLAVENDRNRIVIDELRSENASSKEEIKALSREVEVAKGQYVKWKKRAMDLSREVVDSKNEAEIQRTRMLTAEREKLQSSSPMPPLSSNNSLESTTTMNMVDYTSYWSSSYNSNAAAAERSHTQLDYRYFGGKGGGGGGGLGGGVGDFNISAPPGALSSQYRDRDRDREDDGNGLGTDSSHSLRLSKNSTSSSSSILPKASKGSGASMTNSVNSKKRALTSMQRYFVP